MPKRKHLDASPISADCQVSIENRDSKNSIDGDNEVESAKLASENDCDTPSQSKRSKESSNENLLLPSADITVIASPPCDPKIVLNYDENSSLSYAANFRRSNRILSLKRLNQNLTNTSSTNEDNSNTEAGQSESNLDRDGDKSKSNQSLDTSTNVNLNESNKNSSPQNVSSNTVAIGKSLRKIQVWTQDDIRCFFDAICEHGKDFPRIQSYIASRCEKKGIPQDSIKNYEQVRHFYYRMVHNKISQTLKIPPEIDKSILEIYGLINYGEIWKKFGTKLDNKLGIYLQQLVDHGSTVVKMKGKSVRMRTPICNALKKIHKITDKPNKPIAQPLPKDIVVELIPASNFDWLHVHSIAQNPRLRTKLTMQHRVSTLINYLEEKWDLDRFRRDQIYSLMNCDLEQSKQTCRRKYQIRLKPQTSAKLCDSVTLKSTANAISCHNYRSTTHGTSQIDLSLTAYLKNMFIESSNSKKCKIRKSTVSKKLHQNDLLASDNKDKLIGSSVDQIGSKNDAEDPLKLFKLLDSMNEELVRTNEDTPKASNVDFKNNTEFQYDNNVSYSVHETKNDDEESRLPEPPAHQTLAQWLSGDIENALGEEENKHANEEEFDHQEDSDQVKEIEQNSENQLKENDFESNNDSSEKKIKSDNQETIDLLSSSRARHGWNKEEGKNVTIGELYLLFSKPEHKIILEYSWIRDDTSASEQSETDKQSIEPVKNLSILQKLLIAANLSLMNIKKSSGGSSHQSQSGISQVPASSSQSSVIVNASSSTTISSLVQNNSKSLNRKRPNKEKEKCNSQLLSNLIQETILNDDNLETSSPAKDTRDNNAEKSSKSDKTSSASAQKPKSNRSTTVLNDPAKVEEALKELNVRGRFRRPMPKFMYNPNKMINTNGSNRTVWVLTPSNVHSIEGSNPKQIYFTAIPQTTLAFGTDPTQKNVISVENPLNKSSMFIPIHQLEGETTSVSNSESSPSSKTLEISSSEQQKATQLYETKSNPKDPAQTSQNQFRSKSVSLVLDENEELKNGADTNANHWITNYYQSDLQRNVSLVNERNSSTTTTTLGSLFASATNEELSHEIKLTTETNLSTTLSNDVCSFCLFRH
ncbi:hypothetical protein QR98_0012220 [Sarcoptes scabiei]|uniref:Uncharacterized protein n=1 Tax=Sarcoptes scabiei TaxID=52283 RepID=A0A131ZXG0_SARSC|nr:hypothetical protein QR98_0012220 [Sarcoptes scabiei]